MSKKIILVANTAFTIINFRKELIESLHQKGYEVLVICPEICTFYNGNDVKSRFKALGVRFIPVYINRNGVNPFQDIKLLMQLTKVYKFEKPDIVLNFTIKPTIYSSLAAMIAGVKKLSSNITGLGYLFTDNSFRARLLSLIVRFQYKISLKCNDIIFFQNPDDLDLFCKLKLVSDRKKTTIINGSGVNISKFIFDSEKTKIPMSFIFIGRLLKDKGIIEYVAAAEIIKRKYPESTFRILGGFDDNPNCIPKAYLEKVVKEGIIDYIPSKANVAPYLAESEVFVLPSYREGTPRSVLEAMATGLPIITTDAPGCRETVLDGVNGYLVEVKNVDALCDAIERLIINSELKELMGNRSLEIARTKYDINLVNQSILDQLL